MNQLKFEPNTSIRLHFLVDCIVTHLICCF